MIVTGEHGLAAEHRDEIRVQVDLEWDRIAAAGLAPFRRQGPGRGIEIDLRPTCLCRFTSPTAGEREQREGTEGGIALLLEGLPDRHELLFRERARSHSTTAGYAQSAAKWIHDLHTTIEHVVVETRT